MEKGNSPPLNIDRNLTQKKPNPAFPKRGSFQACPLGDSSVNQMKCHFTFALIRSGNKIMEQWF